MTHTHYGEGLSTRIACSSPLDHMTYIHDVHILIFYISRYCLEQHLHGTHAPYAHIRAHEYLEIQISWVLHLQQCVDGGKVAIFGFLQQRLALRFH